MNIEEIQKLAEIMSQNGLTRMEFEESGKKLSLEREQPAQVLAQPVAMAQPAAVPPQVSKQEKTPAAAASVVASPMVGMFYDSPSPEAEPYVKVGSKVKKGDVLCVIEAMKLLNEITAEEDGEIARVCVNSGEIVEYGQPLFELA